MNPVVPPHAAATLQERPRVLLADDDAVTRLIAAAALRERGFIVRDVDSGQAALDALGEGLPDVIVLDAMMPGLDGFETCRALRLMPGGENVPVLMLTGLDDDASITRAYEVGATDFFVKTQQWTQQWTLLDGRLRYLLRAWRTRLELERSKSKLARAQDLARMGSFEWRRQGGLVLSLEALRVFGQPGSEALSMRGLLRLVPAADRGVLVRMLRSTLEHGAVLTTDIPIRPDWYGGDRVVHVEAEPEFNESGQILGYTGVMQDVTERRVAEDKIRHLANFDALTGLPNRHQLLWRAERALEMARRLGHQCALLLIDLDRFKNINDTLGHQSGDELLTEVARRLRGCVRHSDQVLEAVYEGHGVGVRSHRSLEAVGRLGGDEFVALLPEVGDDRDAERVAQRVLEVMREPVVVGDQECFVTASVGVAICPRDGATVADLMRNADVAMYSVKATGRNASALYGPQLAGRGREKLELETALHKAIERNELVLHYQPKVDVRGARMLGVEALMRWQRGNRLVPPGEFIPLAEESGLIVPLSEWALAEAARQARVWQQGFGFAESIAVNLPSRLFERRNLLDHLHEVVTAQDVPYGVIMLEITEDNLMKDLQNVIPALHRLNEIGVEIAIDDFGTGYSSLSYLTTLPISELKIDRSFVRDLGISTQSSAVVAAIIALARSLGLRVVAEGVETLRQMDVLHRLGVGVMQGFLFSRPVAPTELELWLDQALRGRKASWITSLGESGQRPPELAGRG
ncbi:MAG: EAL domain-containing protein [Rubrivivax sp.]|nr:EAL domain-containing protein [Rubrivivax sp.]